MTPLKALASPSEAQNQGMVHDHYPWFPKRIDGTHGVGYAIWLDANCRHMLHRLLVYGRFMGLDELWRNEGLNSINSDKEKFYSSYR